MAQVFRPELQRDAGMETQRALTWSCAPRSLRSPREALCPAPCPRAPGAGKAHAKLPRLGGRSLQPAPRGGAAAALRAGWLRAGWCRPRSLHACRLPLDPWPAHRPAPASHGPARPPPRPTPAPGGNLKPRLRHLRRPPPAAGRRPARLGFPPRAPSAEAGGDWRGPARPEEGEVAPWRRLPPRGSHRPRLGAA